MSARGAIVVALAALSAPRVAAEPYIAIRAGLDCSACHVNRTGGGGRTAYGAGYGATTLSWKKMVGDRRLFDGAIGERVRIGADGRGGYLGHLRDPGPYLGEVVLSEANLYFGVELLPDRLKLYIDESAAPGGTLNREAFALYDFGKGGLYVKAGKFFLPYGLKLQDDDAASRRGTGFTFESSDLGAEIGATTGSFAGALAVSNGTSGGAEQDNRKQLTVSAAFVRDLGRLAASFSTNDLPGSAHRTVAGISGGFHVRPLVVLAEVDWIEEFDFEDVRSRGGAGHVEADLSVGAGMTVRAWAGAFDLDRKDGERSFSQWGTGADWTPLPGLQLRLMYRSRHGPTSIPGSSDDEALFEVHIYF